MLLKKLTINHIIIVKEKSPKNGRISINISRICCTTFASDTTASVSWINYVFLDDWKLMSSEVAYVNSASEGLFVEQSLARIVTGEARGGSGRRNIESRVIGLARLNARGMRLMPDHEALIALCKSQNGPRPHSYNRLSRGRCRNRRHSRFFWAHSNSFFSLSCFLSFFFFFFKETIPERNCKPYNRYIECSYVRIFAVYCKSSSLQKFAFLFNLKMIKKQILFKKHVLRDQHTAHVKKFVSFLNFY